MSKCTSLSWLLLFYIFSETWTVRSLKDQPQLAGEACKENQLEDQTLAAGSVWQDGDEDDLLHRHVSSLMALYQRARTMFTQKRHTASRTGLDIAVFIGGGLLGIVLAMTVVSLCQGSPSTSSAEERDDDSDVSVVAVGDGLDPIEWWDKSTSSSIIASSSHVPVLSMIAPSWSSTALNTVFKECGLEESWKQDSTIKLAEDLRAELSQGKSSFFSRGGSERIGLRCVVYVMQLALHYVPDNLVLQEFTLASHKTFFVTDDVRLPKTKVRNCERFEHCFLRCLTLKLGISQAIAEKFASNAVLLRTDEEPTTGSAAALISNVSTTVRKLTVLVQLKDVDDELRKCLGIDGGSLSVDSRGMEFRWEKVGEDYGLRRLLKKTPDARKVRPTSKPSGLAVLPWSEEDVKEELFSWGIAPASLGEDLPLLVQMLKSGQLQLGVDESTRKLVCVEHRVYVKVSRRNGDFLVHEGDGSTTACLPYAQLLANETPFVAALRAVRTKLGSISMRVELQLRVRDMQSRITFETPKLFANDLPMKYVVREMLVEALACA